MQNTLPILALSVCAASGIFIKLITTPDTETGRWFDEEACPAIRQTAREVIRKIPFSGLLDWDGVNDYTPRPTLRPLEVVSPAASGYTHDDLNEIYPTH